MSRWVALIGVAVLGTLSGPASRPVDGAPDVPTDSSDLRTRGVVARYLANPNATRRELIAVSRESGPRPPVPLLLLSGDAYVRGKQLRSARRAFAEALARGESEEWTGWASLGLGWLATAQGELGAARPHYERVAAGTWNRDVGVVGLGLLDAAAGRADAAVPRLRQVASNPQGAHRLREVALLATAYAHFWGRDYSEAASAFAAAAAAQPGGPLWDDATYGAGLSQLRGGDRDSAIATLGPLAGTDDSGTRRPRIPSGLLALRVRPVLRASMRRYRSIRFGEPGEQLAVLLDGDGRALARATLGSLGEAVATAPDAVVEKPLGAARERGVSGTMQTARPAPSTPASRSDDNGGRQTTHFPWLALAGALALLALTGWVLASRRRSWRAR